MGTLYYGDVATPIEIEDRALAHVKVVIATKLRRGESFTLSWTHGPGQEVGRSTVWLHPSIPLRFVFPSVLVLMAAWYVRSPRRWLYWVTTAWTLLSPPCSAKIDSILLLSFYAVIMPWVRHPFPWS